MFNLQCDLYSDHFIFRRDLYHCVKFLYPYALPPGLPTSIESKSPLASEIPHFGTSTRNTQVELPQPVTSFHGRTSVSTINEEEHPSRLWKEPAIEMREDPGVNVRMRKKRLILAQNEEKLLFSSSMPPKYSLFDFFPFFPFSLMIGYFADRGQYKGKRAARLRAKMQSSVVSHNLPLEISLYLVSFIYLYTARELTIETPHRVHI